MHEAQRKAVELLTLADADYFTIDRPRLRAMQAAIASLFSGGPPVAGAPAPPVPRAPADGTLLAIGAPARINVTERSEFPVLIAARYQGLRAWQTPYDQNLWIVTVDLDSGRVTSGQPFIPGKREMQTDPSMRRPPPDAIESQTSLSSVRSVPFRAACPIPWQASRLAVTVFYDDQVSNTLRLELTGDEPPGRPLAPVSPEDFPTVSPSPRPPNRAEHAITLTVPSTVNKESEALIQGALRLPSARVPVRHAADGSLRLMASLLFFQTNSRMIERIDLALPVSLADKASAEPMVQTAFTFDLRERLPQQKMSGAYRVFLVVGDRVSGPWPLQL